MSERVSVQEAADILGMSPQGVRVQMQRGILDIGSVLPSITQTGRKATNQYYIYRDKLNRWVGKEA